MIPFSQRQNCTKCDSPHILIPKYHKAWFSRDEWLEYECVCGHCFRTETADSEDQQHREELAARLRSCADLDLGYCKQPDCYGRGPHPEAIDVVAVLDKAYKQ